MTIKKKRDHILRKHRKADYAQTHDTISVVIVSAFLHNLIGVLQGG
jgi:hypothetical protein